jgi:hypothetical protein
MEIRTIWKTSNTNYLKDNMKIKLIMLLFSFICLTACEKREFIVLIEQPTEKNLDNINLKLVLDNNKTDVFVTNLKYSDITPRFVSNEFSINKKNKHILTVYIHQKKFNYELSYPKDKYIVISPFYKNKEINIGIIKKGQKFNLH